MIVGSEETLEKLRNELLEIEEQLNQTRLRISDQTFEEDCDKLIISIEKCKILIPDEKGTTYHVNILQPFIPSYNEFNEDSLGKNPSLIIDSSVSPPKLRDIDVHHSADLAFAVWKCETPRGTSEKKKKMNIPTTIGSILCEEEK